MVKFVNIFELWILEFRKIGSCKFLIFGKEKEKRKESRLGLSEDELKIRKNIVVKRDYDQSWYTEC